MASAGGAQVSMPAQPCAAHRVGMPAPAPTQSDAITVARLRSRQDIGLTDRSEAFFQQARARAFAAFDLGLTCCLLFFLALPLLSPNPPPGSLFTFLPHA